MRSNSGGGPNWGSLNSSNILSAISLSVSRPTRSDSRRGPIGCDSPATTALSTSSTVAKPASTMRIADSRYGTSSAFTTKPDRSEQRTTCLPRTALANCSVRAAAASSVTSVLTNSTSGSTGTGLKKCRPSTRCGFPVAAAIFMIGMLEVLDASTDSGSVTTRSSSAKICALTASSSTTASITSCRSARSLMSVVKASWESARSRSRSVTLPALTPRSSDFTMRLRPAAISASVGSYTVTPTPARTATSAIPDPICPAPTTPTRSITACLLKCASRRRIASNGLQKCDSASARQTNSVELALFGGTGQRGGRRVGVDRGGDAVEVTGTDLALVLGGGVATLLGFELTLLQLDIGAHLVAGVAVGQIEHRVVQRVEAGQRDELELESHCGKLLLELRDGAVVEVPFPVERRRAVVRQHLVGVGGLDRLGELLGHLEVGGAGLHPDQVGERRVGLRARDAGLDAVLGPVETFPGALAGDERLVALVDVGRDERGRFGIGPGDHDGRRAAHVGGQPGRGQRADVLLGGDQHLATQVTTLLLRGQLVLPVRTRDTGGDQGLLQLVDVERATEAGLAVGDDRRQPVLHRPVALDLGDLVGALQRVVDPANHLRHRVGRVQALVGVGVAGEVGVTGDLPARQVDGLEARAHLLDGLVAGQGAERVDPLQVVQLFPQHLRAAAGQGVLLDNTALQGDDVLGGVGTGDVLPAQIRIPVVLDLLGALRGANDGHWACSLTV